MIAAGIRSHLLIICAALAGVPAPAAAQTVVGRLLDTNTREALADATVSLRHDDSRAASVITDADGNFVLTAPAPGAYRLRAERLGYQTSETAALELDAGDTLRVEFRMSVDAVLLNPLEVVSYSRHPPGLLGGFYERATRRIAGVFVTREEIDRRMPLYTTDLLRMVPGVQVTAGYGGNIVRMRGGCVPQVFLDGVPVRLMGTSVDALVSPASLEGIEVYRGPSETPAEFARGSCGAIVLWTRRDDG